MPPITDLADQFANLGYEVVSKPEPSAQFFEVVGGKLENVQVWVRCYREFCTAGLLLGVIEAVQERLRYGLLVDLLELNFEHPLGRLCLVRTGSPGDEKNPSRTLILAETSFFINGLGQIKLDTRMQSLRTLALAASKLLAARNAIANNNPFYSQLKAITPTSVESP